jgi:hypothetical protein
MCFNPRPRRSAGATGQATALIAFLNVSILARAEARALQFASNAMNYNVEKRTLREPRKNCFSQVHTILVAWK